MKTLKLLFGFDQSVDRKTYLITGVTLMLIKYVGECALYYATSQNWLSPLNFISPFLSQRYPQLHFQADWFIPAIILWNLPFIWVGISMSIRRAIDAALSPWIGLFFFVPVFKWFMILLLSIKKTSATPSQPVSHQSLKDSKILQPLFLVLIMALIGVLITWINANWAAVYATSLFIGSPLILGCVQSFLIKRQNQNFSYVKILSYVILTIILIYLLILLFALEGLICILMSLPLSLGLAFIGSMMGILIAKVKSSNVIAPTLCILVLPILPWIEVQLPQTHHDMVLSEVMIAQPPEKVWPNVIQFADLPPANEWLFRLGVAHPVRARIDGHGVGAIRNCEFTTGSFVEPITIWDEPKHLAFDVKFQPQPMKELSFYDTVHAPHLDGYFRSVRGEFILTTTANGQTLLQGRTWYDMDIQPGWYWQIYGRWFIHQIHNRVLNHIKNISEAKV